jgi:hypothetical protein
MSSSGCRVVSLYSLTLSTTASGSFKFPPNNFRSMSWESYSKVREYVQKNGEVCKKCAKKINDIDVFFEKKRERFMQAFDRLLDKAKDEFKEEVQRLANVRDSDK